MRTILSLCDFTGAWSRPYREAGYQVIQVDLRREAPSFESPGRPGADVRLLRYPGEVHGILAAPPCTHFALSGAHRWASKGNGPLLEGLSIVDACLRLVSVCRPRFKTHRKGAVVMSTSALCHKVRDPRRRSVTPSGFARAFFEANP